MGEFMQEVFDNLTKKLKEYNNVLIMSHKNTDLDGLTSSIILCEIARKFKKNSNIFLTEKNDNVKKVENLFDNSLITSNCEKYSPDETLLVVVDTNSCVYVEEPKLLDIYKHVLLIDHHVKNDSSIKNAEMSYINDSLSSIIEFMIFYIRHINFKIDQNLATLMLAGLEIDTNSFNFKTTPMTYKAAGILVELGASLILKQDILRESREDILKRNELLKNSYVFHDVVSICVLDNGIYEPVELAQIADELLHFKNIEISFCLGFVSKDSVRVSIRTIGNYDAGDIALKLGGGGSIMSAASMVGSSLEEAEQKIKELVGEII